MAAVINTNVKALFSQAALASTQRNQSVAMQQLSTGKRINSARDDAAGMAIATRMTHQIRSLNQAVRNAGDAVSMIQTAEGATNEITDMLLRMRELAIQATNDTNSNDQRSFLDLEFQQLKKQIVQVSENTDWNGFPLLNGSAGEPLGPFPVYKATGNGAYDAAVQTAIDDTATFSLNSDVANLDYSSSSAMPTKAGTLSIDIDNSGAAPVVTAKLILKDGTAVKLDATVDVGADGDTIKFKDTALTDEQGTFSIYVDGGIVYADDKENMILKLNNTFADMEDIKSGDVTINGQAIPPTIAKYDTISVQDGNHLSSSIAKAAAINSIYSKTGVRAVVNENIMTGAAMSGDAILNGTSKGTVTINGYVSAKFETVENNTRSSRESVVKAINAISELTGVVATDTGSDDKGITLAAKDGRNINVEFNTADSAVKFSARTGLKQGLQIGTYSLESKVETPVVIASQKIGGAERLGLEVGDFSDNITRVATAQRAQVETPVAQVAVVDFGANVSNATVTINGRAYILANNAAVESLVDDVNSETTSPLPVRLEFDATNHKLYVYARTPGSPFSLAAKDVGGALPSYNIVDNAGSPDRPLLTGDLVINGVEIPGAVMDDDLMSSQAAFSSRAGSSAIAISSAINSKSALTNVTAVVDPPVMIASGAVNSELPATGTYMVYVNGIGVAVDLIANESPEQRLKAVMTALKAQQGQHGVEAQPNGTGGLKLTTVDGRNLSVWFDPTQKSISSEVYNPTTGETLSVALPKEVQYLTADMFGLGTGSVLPQETSITMKGPIHEGDVISMKINGMTIRAKVPDDDDWEGTMDALLDAFSKANLTEFNDNSTDPTFVDELQAGAGAGHHLVDYDQDVNDNYVLKLRSFLGAFKVEDFKLSPADSTQGSDVAFNQVSYALSYNADDQEWQPDTEGGEIDPVPSSVALIEAEQLDPFLMQPSDADWAAGDQTLEDILKSAPDTRVMAKTLYGGVKLVSEKQFKVEAGQNGFGASSNFAALGLTEGTFGGRSAADLSPPRVGRMTFQVGASVGQNITFDLADFGKNGPITQEITWDVDLEPLKAGDSIPMPGTENPIHNGKPLTRSFIGSRDGALEVLAKLDATMDKVNATRATMGAVMNRLDHVITNLTNVSMNLSASRSQIEDADYASASTELAKTQIMQQAATAVLAQANTSQQSVLKLLQGG
jgi:flagellin